MITKTLKMIMFLIVRVFLFNKVPAAVCARHALEARVTDAVMASSCIQTCVTRVQLAARRVLKTVDAIRASLASGDITVTSRVIQGVKEMCVTNMTAVVHVSLDTGDVPVTLCVIQGVKEMCVTQMTAVVRARLDTMEVTV